jgi:predicted transcriptional regulator
LSNVASYLSFMTPALVTPETLPYYLQGEVHSFEREEDMLAQRCGLDQARWVLAALAVAPAGRKGLEETLAARGLSLTEGEVRKILSLLKEAGLVSSRVGRHGSELTPKGRSLVNRADNRHFSVPI